MSAFSYDPMGRTILDRQATPQNPNGDPINYTYDGAGDMTGSSNGNGINYTLSYSVAQRPTKLTTNWIKTGGAPSADLIKNVGYNAFGAPLSSTLYNNMTESWGYDARGRMQSYTAATTAGVTRYSVTGITYSGNSNILSATDSVNGTWSSYTYDDFNRLVGSSCTAGCPQSQSALSFSYVYDRYGNRWNQTATGGGTWNQPSLTFDAKNRLTNTGFTYDAAGNIINDSIHTYTYDAENRIIKVDSGSTGVYTYDAQGRRVAKTAGASSYEYLYDLGGRAITELVAGTTTTNRSEVYLGGHHLATENITLGTTYFAHSDWLGTERVRTNLGNTIVESCSSLAYGDNLSCTGSDVSPLHFTGQMHDNETGLDDFPARYYSSTQGRWYSPDWASAQVPVPYADLHNPQTLNLYDYVGGDPTNHADADGHALYTSEGAYICQINGDNERDEEASAANASAANAAPAPSAEDPAQNTTAAAVVASPTTMEAIDAVVKPLVDSAIGATKKAATVSLDAIGGVVLFIFASSQKTASEEQDTVHRDFSGKKDSAEPEPAAASGGKGVRGGKKDRSGQGNIDQLEGLQNTQKNITKAGGYRISDKKSKQNIDNANKRVKSLEDVENQ